ncbi:unnamed protein product [Candida verbasci]|uniref:TATA element modulatory factor 1 TATA binding domain-containing protein n=1 Tax=Candida verbasci TaxID=1227364 RepID=A0A9W4XAE7_9ASCO|nr:unnamed protein product [Candida verbasci]
MKPDEDKGKKDENETHDEIQANDSKVDELDEKRSINSNGEEDVKILPEPTQEIQIIESNDAKEELIQENIDSTSARIEINDVDLKDSSLEYNTEQSREGTQNQSSSNTKGQSEKLNENGVDNDLESINVIEDQAEEEDEKSESKKPVKKRLTLQERLAQAAKAKSKKSKSISPTPQTPPPSIRESFATTTRIDNSKYIKEIEGLKSQIFKLQSTTTFEKERNELLSKIKDKDDTIDQLRKEGHELSIKELKLNETIKKLKANQDTSFENKFNDLDIEIEEKKKAISELNDSKTNLEVSNHQYKLDLKSKEETIINLKNELMENKSDYTKEIFRLEEKIESLRINQESNTNGSNSVDFNDFTKLNESHHNLQQQYLSSQENWKLIESNLLLKIDNLQNSIDTLKKFKNKLNNENSKLIESYKSEQNKVESLKQEIETLKHEKNTISTYLNDKNDEFLELHDKFEKFRSINNQERLNSNSKIEKLTKEIEKLNESNTISTHNQNYVIEEDPIIESPVINNVSSFNLSRQHSSISFNEEMDNNSSFNGIPTNTTSMTNSNLQLINKMSSNIRRLEIELNTLKDEYNKISNEKESFEQEYLKIIEENKITRTENEKLSNEIDELKIKESTMLELIGEKSELVEELRADVADLKDLCKLQVQQLIEFQESQQ